MADDSARKRGRLSGSPPPVAADAEAALSLARRELAAERARTASLEAELDALRNSSQRRVSLAQTRRLRASALRLPSDSRQPTKAAGSSEKKQPRPVFARPRVPHIATCFFASRSALLATAYSTAAPHVFSRAHHGRGDGDLSNALTAQFSAVNVHAGLADLAMDALSEGISIADFTQRDAPLIYVNSGFCRMTGFTKAETVGHNCRHVSA